MKIEEFTHKMLIAAASAISAAIIGYVFSSFVIKPEYTSTSRYYILEQTEKIYSGGETGYIKSYYIMHVLR